MKWGEPAYEWVGDWSARRASLSPNRTAIVDEGYGESYTYADLDRRANRTARLLRANGVVDEERVALVTRNRIEMLDLFCACGKTGGVLAPLSYRLAPPELAELLDLIEPKLVVIESPYVERLEHAIAWASVEPTVLEIETDEPAGGWGVYDKALPPEGAPVDSRERSLEDPHLLLHTGGSTGTPKETTITHGSIHWNAFNTITAWGLRPDDVAPMVFPSFHTGGWNVLTLPILAMGGCLHIDREVNPGRVLEQVESDGATVLVAVPAVLRTMARHVDWDETDLSTLRFAKSGGGPCRDSVVQAWRERGVNLTQGYGLTEIGPNNFAMPDDFDPEKVASVGRPAPHVDARIVDGDGRLVEQGEIGELELTGPHAAPEYWGNELETAETFGGGWVSTGDLARVDAEGYYHIEGRKKNMFVSGGENVFPPEVEDAVADHPKVEEVVVIGVPDETWGIVGKAVVEGDESLMLGELEAFLDGRIARFKIPAHLAFVDELPTSGPSKLDREAIEAEFGDS